MKILNKFVSMLLLSTMLLILLNIAPTTSYACSCAAPGPVSDELERSAAVFKGKVIGIVDANENNSMKSSADSIAIIIKVDEIWKGINQTEVVVYTERDSASCGFTFMEGQEYLIYASESDDLLRVSLCSRTTDLASASSDLAVLGKGAEPTEQVNIDQKELQGISDWQIIDIIAVFLLGVAVLAAYFVYRSRKS